MKTLSDQRTEMILLSYALDQATPQYGQMQRGIDIRQGKSILQGDSCNTYEFGMSSHTGTHIDCPNHFYADGKKITDYTISDFMFDYPQTIEVKLEEGELLDVKQIERRIKPDTDFLIIASGWGRYRNQDKYVGKGPGLHADIAVYLRKNYPAVRAVGVDFISISSYMHREAGRAAHRAFLQEPNEILIVEDMRLEEMMAGGLKGGVSMKDIKQVLIAPLWIQGADSCPCNVIAIGQKQ